MSIISVVDRSQGKLLKFEAPEGYSINPNVIELAKSATAGVKDSLAQLYTMADIYRVDFDTGGYELEAQGTYRTQLGFFINLARVESANAASVEEHSNSGKDHFPKKPNQSDNKTQIMEVNSTKVDVANIDSKLAQVADSVAKTLFTKDDYKRFKKMPYSKLSAEQRTFYNKMKRDLKKNKPAPKAREAVPEKDPKAAKVQVKEQVDKTKGLKKEKAADLAKHEPKAKPVKKEKLVGLNAMPTKLIKEDPKIELGASKVKPGAFTVRYTENIISPKVKSTISSVVESKPELKVEVTKKVHKEILYAPASKHAEILKFLDGFGWNPELRTGPLNPHWKGAAIREYGTKIIMESANDDIFSVYGSSRDAKYAEMQNLEYSIFIDETATLDPKDTKRYKDAIKNGVNLSKHIDYSYKNFLFMNVYSHGNVPLVKLISQLLTMGKTVFWGGYIFPDNALAGTCHDGEAVWEVRNNRIVFKADKTNTYEHPKANDLLDLNYQLLFRHENFYVLKFSASVNKCLLDFDFKTVLVTQEKFPQTKEILGCILQLPWTVNGLVLHNFSPIATLIRPNVTNIVVSNFINSMLVDAKFTEYKERFSFNLEELITSTFVYHVSRHVNLNVLLYKSFVNVTANSRAELRTLSTLPEVDNTPSIFSFKNLGVGALCLILMFVLRRFKNNFSLKLLMSRNKNVYTVIGCAGLLYRFLLNKNNTNKPQEETFLSKALRYAGYLGMGGLVLYGGYQVTKNSKPLDALTSNFTSSVDYARKLISVGIPSPDKMTFEDKVLSLQTAVKHNFKELFFITVATPILEEMFKRFMTPEIGSLIIAIGDGAIGPQLLPQFLLHYFLAKLPTFNSYNVPVLSMVLHGGYNYLLLRLLAGYRDSHLLEFKGVPIPGFLSASAYSLLTIILISMFSNVNCKVLTKYSAIMNEYKEHYYVNNNIIPYTFNNVENFEAMQSFVPRVMPNKAKPFRFNPDITIKYGDQVSQPSGDNLDKILTSYVRDGSNLEYRDPLQNIQLILVFSGVPVYSLLNCDYSNIYLVKARSLHLSTIMEESNQKTWFARFKCPFDFKIIIHLDENLILNWIDSISENRKKKRAGMALEKARKQGYSPAKSISFLPKLDEKFVVPFVGREIKNVDSDVALQTCPVYKNFMKEVVSKLKTEVVNVAKIMPYSKKYYTPVIAEVACGYSAEDLDKWYDRTVNCNLSSVIVQGDDSISSKIYNGKRFFIECDFSSYDTCQGESVINMCKDFDIKMGMDPYVAELMWRTHYAKVSVKHSKNYKNPVYSNINLEIYRNKAPRRDSGGANTSYHNSIVNLMIWFFCFWNDVSPFEMKDVIESQLGFECKIKISENIRDITFLKGKWWPCKDALHYGPLPSRVLKIGSSLKSVLDVYPLIKSSDKWEVCAKMFMNGQASVLAQLLQIPILRALVKRFLTKSSSCINESHYYYTFIPGNADKEVDFKECSLDINRRYGLELEEICAMEAILEKVDVYSTVPGRWEALLVEVISSSKPPRRTKKSKAQIARRKLRKKIRKDKNFQKEVILGNPKQESARMNTLTNELRQLRMQTNMLGARVNKDLEPKYAKYALAIMDPANHMSKVPDSYNQPTALYKSVLTVPIGLDFSSNPNGNFAILVKPNIGKTVPDKTGFQVMYSKPDCTNVYDDSQYSFLSDPQADIFYSNLGGEWLQTNAGTVGNIVPSVTALYNTTLVFATLFVNTVSVNAGSSAVVSKFLTDSTPVSFLTYDSKPCIVPGGVDIAIYSGLSGWHMVSTFCSYQNTQANTGTKAYFLFGSDVVGTGLTPILLIGASSTIYTNPLYASKLSILADDQFVANVYSNAQGLMWRCNFYYNFDPNKNYYISGNFSSAITDDRAEQNVTFTKVNAPGELSSSFIPNLRPVAQSAILTNVTPNLYRGGVLGCMSCVKGETGFFTDPEDSNYKIRDVAGLSGVNADESGRLNSTMQAAKGAYTFVLPYQSVGETNFVTVNELNSNDYGGIVFAGNVQPVSGVSKTVAFYLKVTTLFEYSTPSRLIETRLYSGETSKATSTIQKIITGNSIIFENPLHMKGIQDMILSALSPIYGVSRLTGTDPAQNFEKFGKVATSLIKNAPSAESFMDLLPLVAGLL